jgi:hypothetical protein
MRRLGFLLPWLGAITGLAGWGLSHQIASNSVLDDCSIGGGGFVLLVCAPALLLAIGGGVASFSVWAGGTGEGEARRFIGLLSALIAALAAFTIILQSLSPLVLPACAA